MGNGRECITIGSADGQGSREWVLFKKVERGNKEVMMHHLQKYDPEIEKRFREIVYDKRNRKTNTIMNINKTPSLYDSGTYSSPDA